VVVNGDRVSALAHAINAGPVRRVYAMMRAGAAVMGTA
jgi:hypothetical protein